MKHPTPTPAHRSRTAISLATIALLAAPANAHAIDLPVFGHVPNINVESLVGGEQSGQSSGNTMQLTPEQAQVAAASPLNHLPLSPTRAPGAGNLVSSERATLMVGNEAWNADAHRFHYNSTDSQGNATVDTALIATPRSPWTGSGPRPVVSIAPGTQGGAEQCDPSIATQTGPQVRFAPFDLIVPYESLVIAENLRRGATVIIIDHHRNSAGNQEYVDNISSAQSLLDATVAAQSLGVDSSAPIGVYGYSQGGSAAASVAERAASYAPELKVAATAAGGPPSNLLHVLEQINGSSLTAAIALAVNSVLDKDPELKRVVSSELSDNGRNILDSVGQYCVGGLAGHHAFETTDQYTAQKEKLATIIDRYAPVKKELMRQKVGNFVPSAPVFLFSGVHDDVIPIGQVRELRDDWTRLGFTELTYVEDATPAVLSKTGLNHIAPMLNNLGAATDYLWSHF